MRPIDYFDSKVPAFIGDCKVQIFLLKKMQVGVCKLEASLSVKLERNVSSCSVNVQLA